MLFLPMSRYFDDVSYDEVEETENEWRLVSIPPD